MAKHKNNKARNASLRGPRTLHFSGKMKSGSSNDQYDVRITMNRKDIAGQKVMSFLQKLFGK